MTKKNQPDCKVVPDLENERLRSDIHHGTQTHGCKPKACAMIGARSKGYHVGHQILCATGRDYLIN